MPIQKDVHVATRTVASRKTAYQQAAERAGCGLSEWVRRALDQIANADSAQRAA